MSEPQARPGSTGSISPVSPAAAGGWVVERQGSENNGSSQSVAATEQRKGARIGSCREQRLACKHVVRWNPLPSLTPATASRWGTSAASRGVRFPSWGIVTSPTPSMSTNATRSGGLSGGAAAAAAEAAAAAIAALAGGWPAPLVDLPPAMTSDLQTRPLKLGKWEVMRRPRLIGQPATCGYATPILATASSQMTFGKPQSRRLPRHAPWFPLLMLSMPHIVAFGPPWNFVDTSGHWDCHWRERAPASCAPR